jgi:hypothetical protein
MSIREFITGRLSGVSAMRDTRQDSTYDRNNGERGISGVHIR